MVSYRFSDVELHTTTREVLLAGRPVDLEPKVFELLIYLIENRSRVVLKTEVLENVWKTSYVSESVLARAVMKLRKALSGDGTEADYIKTVHRVGYRFIGEIIDGEALSSRPPAELASGQTEKTALLPILNLTGDDTLAWVELGLLTLIMRAVASDREIATISIASVLTATQGVGTGELIQRHALLRQALGATYIVQLAVHSAANLQFTLSWTIAQPSQEDILGEVTGNQLTELAMQFAARLKTIVERRPAAVTTTPLTPDEEFANAAHARAIQAFAREQYPQALALMHACADIEPHDMRVDIDLAAMLVPTRPRDAEQHCKNLFERESEMSATDRLAFYRALADLALHDKRWDVCEDFCTRAERLISEQGGDVEDGWIAASRFKVALMRGEINFARHTAQVILEDARHDRDQVRISQALANLGWLELEKGDEITGKSLLTEATDLARTYGLRATQSLCLHERARHLRTRGRVAEAIQLFGEALGLNHGSGYAMDTAQVYANLYRTYTDNGSTSAALGCVSQIEAIVAELGRSTPALRAIQIDALMRFDPTDRARHDALAELAALSDTAEPHWSFGTYLIVLAATGAVEEAAAWLEQLRPRVDIPSAEMSYTTYLSALAHVRYAQGDLGQAQAALERHVAARGGMLAGTLVCTDVLWLALEQGDTDKAVLFATEMQEHLRQTLRGRIANARLHHQIGEPERAFQLQGEAVEIAAGHRALPYLQMLREHYRSKPAARKKAAFPRAPALPSAF